MKLVISCWQIRMVSFAFFVIIQLFLLRHYHCLVTHQRVNMQFCLYLDHCGPFFVSLSPLQTFFHRLRKKYSEFFSVFQVFFTFFQNLFFLLVKKEKWTESLSTVLFPPTFYLLQKIARIIVFFLELNCWIVNLRHTNNILCSICW